MYDIPFDRSFLHLSNGIRHVMPSTDRMLELTAKSSMAQPVSQPALCCNGLNYQCTVTLLSLLVTTLQNLLPFTAARAYLTAHFSNMHVPPHSELNPAVWP